jgi:hypothetical protein
MAVEPKLSDAKIASLMGIPHPSKGVGESIYSVTTLLGAIVDTTRTF